MLWAGSLVPLFQCLSPCVGGSASTAQHPVTVTEAFDAFTVLTIPFSRAFRGSRRRGVRRREVFSAQFDGGRTAASYASLRGVDVLESRLMLSGDAIVVSVQSNWVVLTLASTGVEITDLHTSYRAAAKTLTITAANAGTIGSQAAGITIDTQTDTITVSLAKIPGFAGISIVGGVGADAITIGSGGVNLAAVARGAASQGFVISTGDGVTDTVTIGSRITTKGAGSVSLTTLGTGLGYGI